MTFEILSGATPWIVAFFALAAIGVVLAVVGVVDVVREQRTPAARPVARSRDQRGVRGRLALHH